MNQIHLKTTSHSTPNSISLLTCQISESRHVMDNKENCENMDVGFKKLETIIIVETKYKVYDNKLITIDDAELIYDRLAKIYGGM